MSDDEKQSTPTQRTYGRGVIEGLKIAGVKNVEDAMNNARLKALESGLNTAARKVYEAIPIGRQVTIGNVVTALSKDGRMFEHPKVMGCVAELIDKGLVRGSERGTFERIAPKPVVVAEAVTAPSVAVTEPVAAPDQTPGDINPLERLAQIEGRFRALIGELTMLTSELGTAAIDIEGFIQRVKNDNAKVAQLKELLKSL